MASTNFQLFIIVVVYPLHIVSSECGDSKADIVFILDSSGSVGYDNFQKTKEFFKTMVDGFEIGSNNVRMASVAFSTSVHYTFSLGSHNSADSLKQRISQIPYDNGYTYTNLALKYARQTSFWDARSGVPKIAVVITDGKSNSRSDTLEEARKLRSNGVIIFSVGVGDGVDLSELQGMASKNSYVFDVSSFDALHLIRDKLTKTACKVISCGDPGNPLHGFHIGRDYSKGKSVSYRCDTDYKLAGASTRTCQSNFLWSGSLPSCIFNNACKSNPCQNNATCNNGNTYTCSCVKGYSGFNCENDIQPPVVDSCPSNIRNFSEFRFLNITWPAPEFRDPFNHEVDVTTNYPKHGSSFFWGDYIARYDALKPFNGERSICTFNISVRPYPCLDLAIPLNGALVCNGWMTEYTRVCIAFCKRGTKLIDGLDFRTKYICGGSGNWLPGGPFPSCERSGERTIRRSKRDNFYFFQRCGDEEKDELKEKYLDVLQKSSLKRLCYKYPDLCKKGNVDVRC